jgi:signal transduction histidine kinase
VTRRLLLSYVSITTFVILVLEIPLGVTFARSERSNLVDRVKHDAIALTLLGEERLEGSASGTDLQRLVADYRRNTGGRAVIVDRTGAVLADSGPAADANPAFANRPEIRAALAGREVSGRRHSETLDADLLYVAVPVASSGRVLGAVRVTYPTSFVDRRVRRTWWVLAAVAGVVIVVVLLVSLVLARSVSRPLRALGRTATRLGEGDLAARADVSGPPEVAVLSTTFNAMAAQLEDLVRSQEAFIADASHQLRTPLAALRLRLENVQAVSDPASRVDVDAAVSEVVRLSRMVDGLLALARTERVGPSPEFMDLAEIIEGRRIAWSALAEEREVQLMVATEPRLDVMARPDYVEQVLDNLLANALEASPPRGVITIRAARTPGWIDVHVIDQGPGMAQEERARAFDRFWRASATASRTGTGLGLAIVRRLVASEGGSVELHDAEGGGLDAVVRLPTAR